MAEAPAIVAERLTRDFGKIRAVNGLSLEVGRGTIFGLLGPNGAGKTTTIRLLLGIFPPTRGTARVLGRDPWADPCGVRRRCGVLVESGAVYERLSVEDNLEFFGRIWEIPRWERKGRIRELLLRSDLWDRRRDRTSTLSRGMRQKLAVARALLPRPELLFLDEPTSSLDPAGAARLRKHLLAMVHGEGVTLLLTTHHLAEAEAMCDRVGILANGRLLAVGSPDELCDTGGSTLEQTFLALTGAAGEDDR